MRFFLAGIMQGSLREVALHSQDYRGQVRRLVAAAFPEAAIYDPLADHSTSLEYDDATGRVGATAAPRALPKLCLRNRPEQRFSAYPELT